MEKNDEVYCPFCKLYHKPEEMATKFQVQQINVSDIKNNGLEDYYYSPLHLFIVDCCNNCERRIKAFDKIKAILLKTIAIVGGTLGIFFIIAIVANLCLNSYFPWIPDVFAYVLLYGGLIMLGIVIIRSVFVPIVFNRILKQKQKVTFEESYPYGSVKKWKEILPKELISSVETKKLFKF